MTPEFPQNEREKLEAKLTTLLLGELPPHEEAALHDAMDEDTELAVLYERLKLTIGLVRESSAKPNAECGVRSAALKLSPERRGKRSGRGEAIVSRRVVRPLHRPCSRPTWSAGRGPAYVSFYSTALSAPA